MFAQGSLFRGSKTTVHDSKQMGPRTHGETKNKNGSGIEVEIVG